MPQSMNNWTKTVVPVSALDPTCNSNNMKPDVYSLKWNAFQSHVTCGLGKLLANNELTDVTIACEGRVVKAHKFLLSLCSPFFKHLFQANETGRYERTIIILNNIKFRDLENIIQFMYNGETNVMQADLENFLRAGELLEIEGLAPNSTITSACNQEQFTNFEPRIEKNLEGTDPNDAKGFNLEITSVASHAPKPSAPAINNELRPPNQSPESVYSPEKPSSVEPATSSVAYRRMSPRQVYSRSSTSSGQRLDMNFDDPLVVGRPSTTEIDDTETESRMDGCEFMENEVGDSNNNNNGRRTMPFVLRDDKTPIPIGYFEKDIINEENRNWDDHPRRNFNEHLSETEISRALDVPIFSCRVYKTPERRKTSALWDYFSYNEDLDFVSCLLQKDGRSCTFSARHKPLSNMKYHIRTCHRKEYEVILPRLLHKH